uniref:Uncharacterized protein n=1 Tax=Rhizophora mucronata TaxID=61149 RepID=A0A2P2ITW7_RHIMU
MQSEWSCVL